MLSLRNRFGIPGVISVIALVFALVGGTAFAANDSGSSASASAKKKNRKGKQGGLNAKQKRQVIALAKRFASAGPQGPQGVPGLPGAPGAKGADGDDGSDGSDGSNGSDGASVVTTIVNPGGLDCNSLGGAKFEVGGDTTFACNGAEGAQGVKGDQGDPWTAGGTLPVGATETGAWTWTSPTTGKALPTAIEFSVPLSAALDETKVHFQTEASFGDTCVGTVAVPTAPVGHLCVYAPTGSLGGVSPTFESIRNPATYAIGSGLPDRGAGVSGAVLFFEQFLANGKAWGTYAVTGFTSGS